MTQEQFESRKERAENGALIASRTEEGFRVYSIANPSQIYLVRQEGEAWTCTCPDFETHKADSTWRCKHILLVAPWQKREQAQAPAPANGEARAAAPAAGAEASQEPAIRKRRSGKGPNGSAQMLIKRSVSPDGRIDSVSVEFSMPVSDISNGEIKDKAVRTLELQKEIVGTFLKLNAQKPTTATPSPVPIPQGNQGADGKPVSARMIDIGRVRGKWGDRLCINLQVNGRWSRIFGSADQLALQIARAGYHIDPANIEQGLRLNLACLVITQPSADGKYLNIARVLSLPKGGQNGVALN